MSGRDSFDPQGSGEGQYTTQPGDQSRAVTSRRIYQSIRGPGASHARREPRYYDSGTSTSSGSMVTTSSRPSTVFSRGGSSRGSYPPSTVSTIELPRAPPHPTFVQFAAGQGQARNTIRLPCEFAHILGCRWVFEYEQEDAWINHHIDHMRGHFPEKCVCWFCDVFSFRADMTSRGDRHNNFCIRMQHIHGCILDFPNLERQMRPDFHVLKHMAKHGLIPPGMYGDIMRYTELPKSYRLPGE